MLFCEKAHTLRRTLDRELGIASDVRFIRTVKGRVDLVVCCGVHTDGVSLGCVLIGIEVKFRPSPTTWSMARREAIVQLIGMNIANLLHSPGVVLTDVVERHEFLFLMPKQTEPLQYEVVRKVCASLGEAVAFALTQRLGYQTRTSADFGRGRTPPPSLSREDRNAESSVAIDDDEAVGSARSVSSSHSTKQGTEAAETVQPAADLEAEGAVHARLGNMRL